MDVLRGPVPVGTLRIPRRLGLLEQRRGTRKLSAQSQDVRAGPGVLAALERQGEPCLARHFAFDILLIFSRLVLFPAPPPFSTQKWSKRKLKDPAVIDDAAIGKAGAARKQRVNVIFIRHGESVWNQIFNKGKPRSKEEKSH